MANVFTQGRGLEGLKQSFFDRMAVINRVEAAKLRVLSKFGAFVRRRAQTSLRKRKAVSKPGEPPSSHTGILRRFIFFSYDHATGGVVIGPMKTNQVFFDKHRRPVTGTVPQVLEYGGSITILEWQRFPGGPWERADLRSRRRLAERPLRYRTANIAARPFMRPALAAERPKFSELFRNQVSKARG